MVSEEKIVKAVGGRNAMPTANRVRQRVFIEEIGDGPQCAVYRVVCEGRFDHHTKAYAFLRSRGWADGQIRIGGSLSAFA